MSIEIEKIETAMKIEFLEKFFSILSRSFAIMLIIFYNFYFTFFVSRP